MLDNGPISPSTNDDHGDDGASRRDVARRVLGSPRLLSAAALGTRVVGLAGLILAVGGAAAGIDPEVTGNPLEITCCAPQ